MASERQNLPDPSRFLSHAENVREPFRLKIHQPDEADRNKVKNEVSSHVGHELENEQAPPEAAYSSSGFQLAASFIYSTASMSKLIEKARRYARTNAPILVTGESGTGKELFSRFIHSESRRADKPFVAVNCAALPELIAESELFGHERGAFTGAFKTRIGHFENADGGTLLLDEISEIPITIQAKLLRAIEEHEVQRLGASQPVKVDARIIATSNRNLQNEIVKGTFRLDLYHRLGVLMLDIPPLRNRVEDIPEIACYFARIYCQEGDTLIAGFTAEAMNQLCQYHWPGNIRELRNVVHSACIESTTPMIDENTLVNLQQFSMTENHPESPKSLAAIEKMTILSCLEKNSGNRTLTAAELGVTTRTLSNKLKIYGPPGPTLGATTGEARRKQF